MTPAKTDEETGAAAPDQQKQELGVRAELCGTGTDKRTFEVELHFTGNRVSQALCSF
jgi:hypothetical protein